MIKNNIIDKLLKKTPLEIRIKVAIEAFFITEYGGTFFMPLDEDGNDIPEAVEANRKCFEKAEPLLKHIMEDIKGWKEDGMP